MPQCILTSQITFMAYIHGQDRTITARGTAQATLVLAMMVQTMIMVMELTLPVLCLVTALLAVERLWE